VGDRMVAAGITPALEWTGRVRLVDGPEVEVTTVWSAYLVHLRDYDLDATAEMTGSPKALIERLDRADADALELDARHTTYTPLAELPTATDKARRDAPSIAVCEV